MSKSKKVLSSTPRAHGGRLTKLGGKVASIAPSFGVVLVFALSIGHATTAYACSGTRSAGDDVVNCDSSGTVTLVDTAEGNDTVTVSNPDGIVRKILTGAGEDTVIVNGGRVISTPTVGDFTPPGVILGEGNDTLVFESGRIQYSADGGDGGDNFLMSGGSTSYLYGQDGDDTATVSGGTVLNVDGGNGNDAIILSGTATVENALGRDGNDIISVTEGADVRRVLGGDGDDVLRVTTTASPDLLIDGGTGDDEIIIDTGGAQIGRILAGSGDDILDLRSGSILDEVVTGRGGVTTIRVGVMTDEGADTVDIGGTFTAETVELGAGDDQFSLSGAASVEDVQLNSGNDEVTWSGGSADRLFLGTGSDEATITATEYDGSQLLDGGEEAGDDNTVVDTLNLDGVIANVSGSTIRGFEVINATESTLTLTDVMGETLNLDGGEVTLDGIAEFGAVNGGDNADTLIVSAEDGGGITNGANLGEGDDIVTVEAGSVGGVFDTGTGNDTLTITGGALEDVDAGGGDDSITIDGGTFGPTSGLLTSGWVRAGDGNDTVIINGGNISNDVEGGAGDDVITMTGGRIVDDIHGNDGDDVINFTGGEVDDIRGDAGNDTLNLTGGRVTDEVIAGAGDDLIVLDGTVVSDGPGGPGGLSIGGGDGNDTIRLISGGFDIEPGSFADLVGNALVDGGLDDDIIILEGANIRGRITGSFGDDTVQLNSGSVKGVDTGFFEERGGFSQDDDTVIIAGADVGTAFIQDGAQTFRELSISTGIGNDAVTFTSGTVAGDLSTGTGDDAMAWRGGVLSGGIDLGAGADALTITAATYNGMQLLDGGEELSDDNSVVDTLDLLGVTGSIDGTIVGFEETTLRGDSVLHVTNMSSDELVVSDAVVSAGSAVGEVGTGSVTGSMTFGAESSLAVDFTDYNQADRFVVSGDVSLANGASIAVSVADRTLLRDGESFTALDAEGTLNVGRVAIEDNVGLYNFVEQLDGNALNLTTEMVDLGEQGQAGGAIEDLFEDDHAGVIEQLLAGTTTEEEVHAIVEALSPTNVDAVGAMQIARARQLQGALRERMSVRGVEVSRGTGSFRADTTGVLDTNINTVGLQGGWAQVLSFQSDHEGSGTMDDFTSDAAGFVLGYDRVVRPGTLLGVALSTVSGDATTVSGAGVTQTETEGFGLDIYGAQAFGDVIVRGSLGYDSTSLASSRSIAGVADDIGGEYDATNIRADVAVSRDYAIGNSTFRPFAGLAWDRLVRDAYTEDHGDFGLSFDAHSSDTFEGYLGLTVQKDFDIGNGLLGTELRGRIGYDLGSTEDAMTARFNAGGDSFAVPLSERDDLRTSFGFSVGYAPSDNSKLVLDFDTEFAGDYSNQSLRASYRFEF